MIGDRSMEDLKAARYIISLPIPPAWVRIQLWSCLPNLQAAPLACNCFPASATSGGPGGLVAFWCLPKASIQEEML